MQLQTSPLSSLRSLSSLSLPSPHRAPPTCNTNPHSPQSSSIEHLTPKQRGNLICEMLTTQVFAPFECIVMASDSELPGILVSQSMANYKRLVFYDSNESLWTVFGSKTGWGTHSDERMRAIVQNSLLCFQKQFGDAVLQADRVMVARNLYAITPGADDLIKQYIDHTKQLKNQIDSNQFMDNCMEYAKEFFDRSGVLKRSFNKEAAVLGCVTNEGPALFDCQSLRLITDQRAVRSAYCTYRLGVCPPAQQEQQHQQQESMTDVIAFNTQLDTESTRFVWSQLASTIFTRAGNTISVLQLCGDGASRLINILKSMLGDYFIELSSRKQTVHHQARVVSVCNDERLACWWLEQDRGHTEDFLSSVPLLLYHSSDSNDLTISSMLHQQTKTKMVCIEVTKDSVRNLSSLSLWHLLITIHNTLSPSSIPSQLQQLSDPKQQDETIMDKLIEDHDWSPGESSTHSTKQVVKIALVSERFHALAKELHVTSIALNQVAIVAMLEKRKFHTLRPRGCRQVVIFTSRPNDDNA